MRDLSEASGVLEYWQIDGEHRAMLALALMDGRYHLIDQTEQAVSSFVLPGLVVDLAELFADLP
jgi:Uma2 family endonuclease